MQPIFERFHRRTAARFASAASPLQRVAAEAGDAMAATVAARPD